MQKSKIRTVDFSKTRITGGFWKQKQTLVRRVTTKAVYDRFSDTGRIDAFRFDWQPGQPNQPHFFWDSDVAKWIEGAAYQIALGPDARLEKKIDSLVDLIAKNQQEDGYYNIYFTIIDPQNKLRVRDWHELYCAGHLMEAAVAYYNATGKRKFLDCMCRYADYIEKRFLIDADVPFKTPGHEEIELALVRLYECTGEERYLDLAKHFIDMRGNDGIVDYDWVRTPYAQSHLPVREQKTAEGHAVRAMYLYCGMADVAFYTGDEQLKQACEAIFDNVASKRMYITGGIGSSSAGEAFTVDYDLPNLISYTESCAALALALFANRMLRFGADSKYADVVERVIYNGFMSSLSLDGKSFFYQNPLEILPYMHTRDVSVNHHSVGLPPMQRSEVFQCSCCPPNIVRFIPSIANMLYSDDGEVIYVHQFMQSLTTIEHDGKMLVLEQSTRYPENGKVRIKLSGGDARIAVRIPGWFEGYTGKVERGYACFDVKDGEELTFDFTMKPVFIEARPEVIFDAGRYAVMRGPVLYCMESADNGTLLRDIALDSHARFSYGKHPTLGVPQLTVRAWRTVREPDAPLYRRKTQNKEKINAVLIPYYAFANRGESEMQVWHFVK
ncbi:MAG: glycoside hydrolase family 127 protein [Clostridia bacterium]|nr:glycoside hydrolase family 127 protein [Clostridia bacterium]